MCGVCDAGGVRTSGESAARAEFKIKAVPKASADRKCFVAAVLGFMFCSKSQYRFGFTKKNSKFLLRKFGAGQGRGNFLSFARIGSILVGIIYEFALVYFQGRSRSGR